MPEIRLARPEDLSEILNLCEAHAEYERSEYEVKGKSIPLAKALFGNPKKLYCLLAVEQDTIIGYATYAFQYSTWDASEYTYLDCLYLYDEHRGRGIGEQLMNEVKAQSQKLGVDLIQWQTPDFNERAIKFYKKIGAVSKSKERFFWKI